MKKDIGMLLLLFFYSLVSALSGCSNLPPKKLQKKSRELYIKNLRAREEFSEIFNDSKITTNMKAFNEAVFNLSEKYPDELIIKVYSAALLGDYGQTLSLEEEIDYKERAVKSIKPYLIYPFQSSIGFDRILVFNEYYYHSSQYMRQYQFGREVNEEGGSGHFSVAVGSAMYALELDEKGFCEKSKSYASESVTAWLKVRKEKGGILEKNPFYIVAVALSGGCRKSSYLYDELISGVIAEKKNTRWYNQFDSHSLKCCEH